MGLYFLCCLFLGCNNDQSFYNQRFQPFTNEFTEKSGYNLLEPSETYILPEVLTEISGLATVSDSVVVCLQDESGVIFFFSLTSGEIIERHRFEGSGDYEGIEAVGDNIYALKSNGNLYRYSLKTNTTEELKTPLKGKNNAEGLGHDPSKNRLLIACKGKAGLDDEDVKGRAVYEYHLENGFNREMAYHLRWKDLESWNSSTKNPLYLNQRKKNFMPSGIAVHPITNEIYLLANVGKLLLVLSPEGTIRSVVPLSPRVFRQPEGICFISAGDLIIANEGQDGNGKIQVFERIKGLRD